MDQKVEQPTKGSGAVAVLLFFFLGASAVLGFVEALAWMAIAKGWGS